MTSPFNDPRVSGVFDRAFSADVRREWPDYTRFTPWLPLARPRYPIRSGEVRPSATSTRSSRPSAPPCWKRR